jgi:large subunit ribosomal protein L4
MTKITVKTLDYINNKSSTKELEIESDVKIQSMKNLSYVVRWQLAKSRIGSAKTKLMSEISGTTAKPWKQKGTGRARQGSRRSVQFVGGRTCHGPMPRSFDFSIPSKIIKLATKDALKIKISENSLFLIDNLSTARKTREVAFFFKTNKIDEAMLISQDNNKIAQINNLKNFKIVKLSSINPNDLLSYKNIIVDGQDTLNKVIGVLN